MASRNSIIPLILSFLVTLGVLAGGFWLLRHFLTTTQSPSTTPIPESTAIPEPVSSQPSQTLAQVTAVPEGLFNYGGSTTWAPIRGEIDPVIKAVWPSFQLRYTEPINEPPGSATGIRMLINNQLTFAQSSRPLNNQEYQDAQTRGFTLEEIPVAIDGIAVAVNQTLKLPGITVAQLKDIYTGKITNWQQVGGPDLPILVYSRSASAGGTVEFFVDNVLQGESFGPQTQFIATTTEALRKVSENPGAIYYASAPEVVPQCSVQTLALGKTPGEYIAPYTLPAVTPDQCPQRRNQLHAQAFQSGEYPITRNLFVIIKQNGQIDEQAGLAYANLLLSDQGQELIEKSGYVRIR